MISVIFFSHFHINHIYNVSICVYWMSRLVIKANRAWVFREIRVIVYQLDVKGCLNKENKTQAKEVLPSNSLSREFEIQYRSIYYISYKIFLLHGGIYPRNYCFQNRAKIICDCVYLDLCYRSLPPRQTASTDFIVGKHWPP